jgi:hypothetical protein
LLIEFLTSNDIDICLLNETWLKNNKLKKIIDKLPKPIFISGDLNAHHIAFGCNTTQSRGNEIYNMIDDQELCILNTGFPTTVASPHKTPSAIDVSFISANIAPLCTWNVHEDPMGSDHYPTLIHINISPKKLELKEPSVKFSYAKTNWKKYCETSELLYKTFVIDNYNPITSYNAFIDILLNLREKCIPKHVISKTHIFKTPAPCWNDTCKQVVKKSQSALKQYRKYPTVQNFIAYKRLDAVKKKVLNEEKKKSWENLCTNFNRTTPSSKIWNFIRKFKRISFDNSFKKKDDWIPSFMEKLAPNLNDDSHIEQFEFNEL